MAVTAPKKKRAFRLRLQRMAIAMVAKECDLSPTTVRKLEQGWVDKRGVRHPGWREELERMWLEEEQSELESGFALRKERIKAYEQLARQAIDLVNKQFPSIRMKNAADAKALMSEIRELIRLISIEKGEYRTGPGTVVAVKTDISLAQLQDRYAQSRETEVEVVSAPEEMTDAEDRLEEDAGT